MAGNLQKGKFISPRKLAAPKPVRVEEAPKEEDKKKSSKKASKKSLKSLFTKSEE